MTRGIIRSMRTVSKADLDLVEELAGLGVDASPTILERLREAHVLIPQQRGRGRGALLRYPPQAAEQLTEIIPLLGRGRSLSVAVLTLFARASSWLDEEAIKRAYHIELDRRDAQLNTLPDVFDSSERAAQRIRREGTPAGWRQRLNVSPDGELSGSDRLHSALTCMVHVLLTGHVTHDNALRDMLEASGAAELAIALSGEDEGSALAPVESMLHRIYGGMSIDALHALVDTVTLRELKQARRQVRKLSLALGRYLHLSEIGIAHCVLAQVALNRRLSAPEQQALDDVVRKLQGNSPARLRQQPAGMAPGGADSECAVSVAPARRARSSPPAAPPSA
jgi:hypothetical protein